MAEMKLKHLEAILGQNDDFEDPKLKLEQYMTPPHLAAIALHTIESRFGDISGKLVADLGCGSGMLTVGALVLGASFCVSIDVESDALSICQKNLDDFELKNVDLIQMDVIEQLAEGKDHRWKGLFDCVIMNPPFGTKGNEGIDRCFLEFALLISHGSVYSMHKTATREYMTKLAENWGVEIEVVASMIFDLPNTYSRHRYESVDIEVDLLRFSHVPPGQKPRHHNIPMPLPSPLSVSDKAKDNRQQTKDREHSKGKGQKKRPIYK